MVRIKEDIWEDFKTLCKEEDTTASQDIKEFVRSRIVANKS
jgi:hypothetical protein